jgi:amino acid adenylation domain-containing protein
MTSIKASTILELFFAHAEQLPGAGALLSTDGGVVSYGQLKTMTEDLSRRLKESECGAGDRVFWEYSSYDQLMAGVLGTLGAGAVAVPVPSSYPLHLRRRIRAACRPHIHMKSRDGDIAVSRLEGGAGCAEGGLLLYLPGEPLRPEGILLTEASLVHWLRFHLDKLKVDTSSTLMVVSCGGELGFPVWLANLISGGTVCIVSSEELTTDFLPPAPVTNIVCPLHLPLHLPLLRQCGEGLKNLVTYGSDVFPADHLKGTLKERGIRWHNYYGFPEAGLITTLAAQESERGFAHAGRPLVGTTARILNTAKQKVPVGVAGTLYLAGKGVLDGLFLDGALDQARFVKDESVAGGILFDTGIQALWQEDGKISIQGYGEGVLTINGLNTRLDTLETVLKHHPSVHDAAVYLRDDIEAGPLPAAAVVSDDYLSHERLNAFLKQSFPADWPDVEIVSISTFPRTPEGAIDRQALKHAGFAGSRAVAALEELLRRQPDIADAAVTLEEKIEPRPPYHLDDVLPHRGTDAAVGDADRRNSEDDGAAEENRDHEQWVPALSEGGDLPDDPNFPKVLPDALVNAAANHPRHGIICVQPDGSEAFISYEALLDEAKRVSAGLRDLGLKPGDKAIFQAATHQDYIAAFWGCTLGGIVPVPLNVPKSFAQPNNETQSLENIWNLLDRTLVIVSDSLEQELQGFFPDFQLASLGTLRKSEPCDEIVRNDPEEPALILFTSGSTGTPKGVVQCHRSILLREMGAILYTDLTSDEITLNWLALEHVVGLLMFHLKEVVLGCTQIHVKTDYILAEPLRWLDLISKHEVTNIFAPNFAFALLNERLEQTEGGDWDLTRLRIINVGAEAIDAANMKKLLRQLQPYGLAITAVHPSWGMSETSSGVVYSKIFQLGNDNGVHTIQKASLTGKIQHCEPNVDSVTLTEVGKPFAGVSLRIVDHNDNLKAEGEVGRLHIKGVTITSGYYKNPELNEQVFTKDGWFDTGDLAFIYKKGLTITGRVKDVIIINGVNYNNGDIESTVETVPNVELSFTAACAVRPAGQVSDKLAVFYNSSLMDFKEIVEQTKEIVSTVNKKVGIHPDFVIPVTKEDIPKTSIGKIQRSKLVKRFEEGDFHHIQKKTDIALENQFTIPNWFYTRAWRRQPPAPLGWNPTVGRTIVWSGDGGLADHLIPSLSEEMVKVTAGAEFKRVSHNHVTVDPQNPEHYMRALEAATENRGSISGIIHLLGYTVPSLPLTGDTMEQSLWDGVYSLLYLVQALDRLNLQPSRLLVATGLAQAAGGGKGVRLERSPMCGFLKSLGHEVPWMQCCHLDLETGDQQADAAYLWREWNSAVLPPEVAYRDGCRLVPGLTVVDLDKEKERALDSPLKTSGLYLVTGGLGGVGRLVSEWLLERFGVQLIISGRSDLQGEPASSPRVQAYEELRKKGEVIYGAGDVADVDYLRQLIQTGETTFGKRLDGVFHLAGVGNPKDYWQHSEDFYAINSSPKSFSAMFRGKIFGAVALKELLNERPEALLVCFSSIISEFGASAYCPYAAANSFLDCLPAARSAEGGNGRTLTIAWSSWENIGVNEGLPSPLKKMMEGNGFRVMKHRQGLDTLDIALSLGERRLLVGLNGERPNIRRRMNLAPGPRQWLRVFVAGDNGQTPDEMRVLDLVQRELAAYKLDNGRLSTAVHSMESLPLKDGELDYHHLSTIAATSATAVEGDDTPLSQPEERLAGIWKEILGIDNIHRHDNFFELGGNSLKAITLAAKIHKDLDIELPLGKIFEIPTIKELSQYIELSGKHVELEIPKAERREDYVCSPAQKRMFVLHRMNPDGIVYNMPAVRMLNGALDLEKFRETFGRLVDRHESLRTSFLLKDGEPRQLVHDETGFDVEILPQEDPVLLVKQFIRPFDLAEAPLFRVALAPVGQDRHLFMMDMHHIVSDGVSMGIIISDFMALYREIELEEQALHYKDYAEWQDMPEQRQRLRQQLDYWKNQFSDEIPILELPLDHPRQAELNFAGGGESFTLDAGLTTALTQLAQSSESTLYMALLAIFYTLLSRLSGQEDVVIGTPVAGRSHADLHSMVGMFVNTLPLRSKPGGDLSFNEFLHMVKTDTLEAFQRQDLPFEELVEALDIRRDASRNPLFDVLFVMQNQDAAATEEIEASLGGGLTIEEFPREDNVTKFDLQLNCLQRDGELHLVTRYRRLLFDPSSIQRFNLYFQRIAEAVCDNPHQALHQIEILTARERDWLLKEMNDTAASYPTEQTLTGLFQKQAQAAPDRVAVVLGDKQLSYGNLDAEARELALQLAAHGVEHGSIVALMMERSMDMAITLMAIQKVGAAYLPIDPDYPAQRIDHMLTDSGAILLLINEDIEPPAGEADSGCLCLRVKNGKLTAPKETAAGSEPQPPRPDSLAYVIYTSGSTGLPKGVAVQHRPVVNLIHYRQRNYNINCDDRMLLFSNICFDASVEQFFLPLLSGAVLVMVDRETLLDIELFQNFLERHRVTQMHAVPSFLNQLEPNGDYALKRLLSGGDVCPPALAEKWRGKVDMYNRYGPTETTVAVLEWKIPADGPLPPRIPIGTPMANTQVYVLDRYLKLVPVGVAGELYIGGDCLARGYLKRPQLTEERFVPGPMGRLYRSGDLARRREDGTIEFLSRVDHQVKVRGYRIELGEIEAAFVRHPQVDEAVVDVRGQGGEDSTLVSYVSLASSSDMETSESVRTIKSYLADTLPDYMIPPFIVVLDELPRTVSGKVDRCALPEPGLPETGEVVAPRNEAETRLAAIWSSVLSIPEEQVSVTAGFFDCGGHSLKAVQLLARIHKAFGVKIPLIELFKRNTIEDIGRMITAAGTSDFASITPAPKMDYYPLSAAQQRMLILQQMEPDGVAYNIPVFRLWKGEVDRERLQGAFNRLIQRHEALRTSFHLLEGQPVQRVAEEVEFTVDWRDNAGKAAFEQRGQLIRPFHLDQAPLMRVSLIQLELDNYLFFIDLHHIIADGLSMAVLVDDFSTFYNGGDIEPLIVQYKDVSYWQQSDAQQELSARQAEYWRGQFQDSIPVLELPYDYPRPAVQSFEGDVCRFKLGAAEKQALEELGRRQDATLFMVLLAVFDVLLARLSGQEDIVTGTPVAGRRHADLEPVVGVFINSLALRSYPEDHKPFMQLLSEIREHTIQVFDNQEYPFEELVEQLPVNRDTSRNPLFDVMFGFHNQPPSEGKISSFLEPVESPRKISKFDLMLTAVEGEEGIDFSLEYCTALFKSGTIDRFSGYFLDVIGQIIRRPALEIGDVELLTAREKDFILQSFNNTDTPLPMEGTVLDAFLRNVARTPEQIALKTGDRPWTYREFYNGAAAIAQNLKSAGVKRGSIVAVMMERSPHMLMSMYAVWLAGGAYLPIDPLYPADRIRFVLEDSDAVCVLTLSRHEAEVDVQRILVDTIDLEAVEEELAESELGSEDLAYVIYTSGTTGRPKGVLIQHQPLLNRLCWMQDQYPLQTGDVILQKTTVTFDVSVWELFWWAMTGASVCLLEPGGEKDPAVILEAIEDHGVTVMHFVPSMLGIFLEVLEQRDFKPAADFSLRRVFASGEALLAPQVKTFYSLLSPDGTIQLVNLYGPTEATVDVSYFDCPAQTELHNVPIGKPIWNTRLYVTDRRGRLQPPGVVGELWIGGLGLAKGYLKRPELTTGKFIEANHIDGQRVYRTGDLARLRPDGEIEFLGRIDHQVKIRGFRIELGEIESLLLRHPSVGECAVLARGQGDNAYLCAYTVSGGDTDVQTLKDYLAASLPDYMIPTYFVPLDQLPVTANGKLDRRALPEPDILAGDEYVAPQTATEKALADMWAAVLSIEPDAVGVESSFFQLGGHSLKAVQLAFKVHEHFGARLSVLDIFKTPTIRGLARRLNGTGRDTYQSIPPAPQQDHYRLSAAQQRIYLTQQMDPAGTGFNMMGLLELIGAVDAVKLEAMFEQLIARHEVLRTSFEVLEHSYIQRVHQDVEFSLERLDVTEEALPQTIKEFSRPFDLDAPPLFRVGLFKLGESRYVMALDIHHIVSDGISADLLAKDALALYRGETLEPLKVQYKDYADWTHSRVAAESLAEQRQFWLEEFSGQLPVLDVPTDFPRPDQKCFKGEYHYFTIPADLTAQFKDLLRSEGATVFMGLMSIYYLLLSKYSRQEDIVIGTTVDGRWHPALQPVIGIFVNMLAIRTAPLGSVTFRGFLEAVHAKVLAVMANQDYQYEELIRELGLQGAVDRDPLFSAVFNMQLEGGEAIDSGDFTARPYRTKRDNTVFDIILNGVESGDTIEMTLILSRALFKPETGEKMTGHFVEIIRQVVTEPDIPLKDIKLSLQLQAMESEAEVFEDGDFEF